MSDEEMSVIAEKIQNKTATKNEILGFIKEFNRLLSDINKDLVEK